MRSLQLLYKLIATEPPVKQMLTLFPDDFTSGDGPGNPNSFLVLPGLATKPIYGCIAFLPRYPPSLSSWDSERGSKLLTGSVPNNKLWVSALEKAYPVTIGEIIYGDSSRVNTRIQSVMPIGLTLMSRLFIPGYNYRFKKLKVQIFLHLN